LIGFHGYFCLLANLNGLHGNGKVGWSKAYSLLEKNMLKRINDIQLLPPEDKTHLFALMDAFLRDHKARKVFVQ
jgi:hypothetical protein